MTSRQQKLREWFGHTPGDWIGALLLGAPLVILTVLTIVWLIDWIA